MAIDSIAGTTPCKTARLPQALGIVLPKTPRETALSILFRKDNSRWSRHAAVLPRIFLTIPIMHCSGANIRPLHE